MYSPVSRLSTLILVVSRQQLALKDVATVLIP